MAARHKQDRPALRRPPMAVRPRRPAPEPARRSLDPALGRAGRRAGLAIAAAGLFWIAGTALGEAMGWPQRLRALCDLFALAGFGFALYLTYGAWRLGRAKGD